MGGHSGGGGGSGGSGGLGAFQEELELGLVINITKQHTGSWELQGCMGESKLLHRVSFLDRVNIHSMKTHTDIVLWSLGVQEALCYLGKHEVV